jgi:hypothetical protein
MRTKCAQKRECTFFIGAAATTYGFKTLNRTHFNPPLNLAHNLNRPGESPLRRQAGFRGGLNPKLTISDQN